MSANSILKCGLFILSLVFVPQITAVQLGFVSQIPIWFEPNTGHYANDVRFVSHGKNYLLLLKGNSAELTLSESSKTTIKMQLINANNKPAIVGIDKLEAKVNYFCGNKPANWRKNIPTFSRVRYENIYSGIDLIYYMTSRNLEYDFILAPNANPSLISLQFAGYQRIAIDAKGNLILHTAYGKMYLHKPICYQETPTGRKYVEGRYVLKSNGKIGFALGEYDKSKTLIIDPVLTYCTYFGGTGNDTSADIAIDDEGNIYVTGNTASADLDTEGAYAGHSSGYDAFVLKLNPAGTRIIYCTYIGGSGSDSALGIAVTGENKVCIVGKTSSIDFPEQHAVQTQPDDGDTLDGFIAMFSEDGSELIFSTYFGGSSPESEKKESVDTVNDVAIDINGDIYVVGATNSSDFPTYRAYQEFEEGCGYDVFVAKLGFNDAGNPEVIYSTYLRGHNDDRGFGIAVDAMGYAYVTGWTASNDFPTTEGVYQPEPGLVLTNSDGTETDHDTDVFVTKLRFREGDSAVSIVYSTYLGDVADDEAHDIALDSSGNASIVGFTASPNFPVYNAADDTMGLGGDAFVAKLNADGSDLIFSTFWGGSNVDRGMGIAVDTWTGDTYIVGNTFSTDFPISHAISGQDTNSDSEYLAAFIAKFNENGEPQYSTYLKGTGVRRGIDSALAAAVIPDTGDLLVTGTTTSQDFPVTEDAIQATHGGAGDGVSNSDIFIAKISPSATDSSDDDSGSSGTNCFVTAVTAGTPLAKGLPILRRFRDTYLKTSSAGRWIIRAYYTYSPVLSSYANTKPAMKLASRITIAALIHQLSQHFANAAADTTESSCPTAE